MPTYCCRSASAMEIPRENLPGLRKLPLPPLLHEKYRWVDPCAEGGEGGRQERGSPSPHEKAPPDLPLGGRRERHGRRRVERATTRWSVVQVSGLRGGAEVVSAAAGVVVVDPDARVGAHNDSHRKTCHLSPLSASKARCCASGKTAPSRQYSAPQHMRTSPAALELTISSPQNRARSLGRVTHAVLLQAPTRRESLKRVVRRTPVVLFLPHPPPAL